jgi:hypothetical protein
MKKDFLLSEEVKNRRKRPVKENRNISSKSSFKSETTSSSNSESLPEKSDDIDRVS